LAWPAAFHSFVGAVVARKAKYFYGSSSQRVCVSEAFPLFRLHYEYWAFSRTVCVCVCCGIMLFSLETLHEIGSFSSAPRIQSGKLLRVALRNLFGCTPQYYGVYNRVKNLSAVLSAALGG